jgi:hemerythrin superfamily protein
MTSSDQPVASDGLVAAIQEAHEQIKSLLNDVAAGGAGRASAFEQLAKTAAAHEAAEQKVVHPLTRTADGGGSVAAARLEEEKEGEQALKELKNLGVDNPGFSEDFTKFRAAVLQHATNEETQEHPILERALSAEASRQAAEEFRAAQSAS